MRWMVPSLLLMAAVALPVRAAPQAHQHGVLTLSASVDGAVLTLDLDSPLDSLLGFERAPRTPAERAAAQALLKRLGSETTLWHPTAQAGCTLERARVDAPVLQSVPGLAGEHADLEATYEFKCAEPARLTGLSHDLFTVFPRLQRIQWQFALPSGQGRRLIERPAAELPLTR